MHRVMAKILSCFHIIEALAPWPIAAHIPRMVLPGLTPGMGRKDCMILAVWVEPSKQGVKGKSEIQTCIDPNLNSLSNCLILFFQVPAMIVCIESLHPIFTDGESGPKGKWLRTTIWTQPKRRTKCHLSHTHGLSYDY